MDTSSLKIFLQNNLNMLYNESTYKEYLNQSVNIQGYDFTNRFLVFFQNRKSTDVKSEHSWVEAGRKLSELNKPIWILLPTIKTTYIDSDSGEELKNGELNPLEINQAIQLGVVSKIKEIVDFQSSAVYDISDTYIIDKDKAKQYEEKLSIQNIKLNRLYETLSKTFKINIHSNSKNTFYDKNNYTLYLGNEAKNIKIPTIIEIIVKVMLENNNNDNNCYTDENYKIVSENVIGIEDDHRGFIIDSVVYTLSNYLENSFDRNIDYVNKIYLDSSKSESGMEMLFNTMNCIENIIGYLLSILRGSINIDYTSKYLIIKRAEQLLDLMEANNTMIKIRECL